MSRGRRQSHDAAAPPAITFSSKIGGRREIKYFPFVPVVSASGPTLVGEGDQATYNFFTNYQDGTYSYSVTPTGRYTVDSADFTVSSGLGSFTLSAGSNASFGDTETVTVSFLNPLDEVLTTLTTSISDRSPVTAPDPGAV